MIPRAMIVPITERLPFFAVCARTKNFAFGRENEIGPHRELEIGQAGFEQIDRTTGINRKLRAGALELANQFHAIAIEHRLADARDERPVEVDAEKANVHCRSSTLSILAAGARVRARV